MAKFRATFFLLIVLAGLSVLYFKNDLLNLYNNLSIGFSNFQKTEIGNLISQVSKEVFTPPPLNIGGKSNNVILTKEKIILETNLQRQDNGLIFLSENSELDIAAKAKANDMFKNQYFEHISPSGISPGELIEAYGYEYIVTGENLILGNFATEKDLVRAWMDSPGHRANILNNRYSEIGVAIVKGEYKGESVWIGVQEFGLPLSSCYQPSEALKLQIDSNKAQLDSLASLIEAKANEIDNTSRRSTKYNELIEQYNQLVEQYQPIAEDTKDLISQYNKQVSAFNQCVAGN